VLIFARVGRTLPSTSLRAGLSAAFEVALDWELQSVFGYKP
jgi:hypothetical protein